MRMFSPIYVSLSSDALFPYCALISQRVKMSRSVKQKVDCISIALPKYYTLTNRSAPKEIHK